MKKMSKLCVLCVVAAIMATTGCIEGDPLPADDDSVDAGLPDDPDAALLDLTLHITATPSTIMVGGSSTVKWVSTGTDYCYFGGNSDSEHLDVEGSVVVSPTTTTSYQVTCNGLGNHDILGWATVTVNQPAPTEIFAGNPETITAGQSSTLSWTTTHATSCVSSGGWAGGKPVNGSYVVSPTETTSYSLTCTGAGGSVVKTVTVTVNPAPAPICHGLYVTFTESARADIDHCSGWTATGGEVSLSVGLQVNGGDGVCAITCPSKSHNGNVLPSAVSGVWLQGATADVQRWTTTGCKRLPDHPATEADQAGGAWDKRCDLY